MTKELFKFPIILIDGNAEDKKIKDNEILGLSIDDPDPDLIYAEAECPYYDFISVSDRWLPTDDSFENAKRGIFDACNVFFANSGAFIVPMPKERFKKDLELFIKSFEKTEKKKGSKSSPEVKILKLSEKDVIEMLSKKLEEDIKKDNEEIEE